MIQLNIIQEQYARMTDEELEGFAINESDKLTLDSFHLLKAEFEKRKMDLGIIESAKIDKELTDLNNQSTFGKLTAHQFAESLWQYSLDEKEGGKTNFEIYNNLLNKVVDEKYAFMIIQSLETTSKKLVDNYNTQVIAGWIMLSAGFMAIVFGISGTLSQFFILYGFLASFVGILRLYKNYSKKAKYQEVLENIDREKINMRKNNIFPLIIASPPTSFPAKYYYH